MFNEHKIQTFEVVVVGILLLLLFNVVVPISAHPYYFWTSGLSKYTYMSIWLKQTYCELEEMSIINVGDPLTCACPLTLTSYTRT